MLPPIMSGWPNKLSGAAGRKRHDQITAARRRNSRRERTPRRWRAGGSLLPHWLNFLSFNPTSKDRKRPKTSAERERTERVQVIRRQRARLRRPNKTGFNAAKRRAQGAILAKAATKRTIPRHQRAVFTFGRAVTPLLSASDLNDR